MIEAPLCLSGREQEIVELAAAGLTDNAICARLRISGGTLGTYWARVRTKAGCSSRSEITSRFERTLAEAQIGAIYMQIAKLSSVEPSIAPAFNQLPSPCFLIDPLGCILTMNRAASNLAPKFGAKHLRLQSLLCSQSQACLAAAIDVLEMGRSTIAMKLTFLGEPDASRWFAVRSGEEAIAVIERPVRRVKLRGSSAPNLANKASLA